MERIKLTRNEKRVLRLIADGHTTCPAYIPTDVYASAVYSLEQYGFVRVARVEGGSMEDVRLTERGRGRIAADPGLCTPTDWRWVITTAIAAIGAIAAVAALLVACGICQCTNSSVA